MRQREREILAHLIRAKHKQTNRRLQTLPEGTGNRELRQGQGQAMGNCGWTRRPIRHFQCQIYASARSSLATPARTPSSNANEPKRPKVLLDSFRRHQRSSWGCSLTPSISFSFARLANTLRSRKTSGSRLYRSIRNL